MHVRKFNRLHRKGTALAYVAVAAVALFGIASLAADFGHVQLRKWELQRTVDAAVRAGASGLPVVAEAQSRAIATAAQNEFGGSAFSLGSSEIEFVSWDNATQSSTVLSGANRSLANAIRVSATRTVSLTLARVIGRDTIDLTASSIAMIQDTPLGFVALESLKVKNNTFIGSYNSSSTTDPTQAGANSKAALTSNGDIEGKNNNVVKGNIVLGPNGTVDGFIETGTTQRKAADIETPADPLWAPSGNPGGVPQNYTASGTVTLPGGTYWFTSLTVNGTLSFSGSATIYLNGNADVNGNLHAANKIPANLLIYQIGANRAWGDSKNNNVDIIAAISSPGGTLTAKNNFDLRGSILFKHVEFKNNADIFLDEALGDPTVTTRITTVR